MEATKFRDRLEAAGTLKAVRKLPGHRVRVVVPGRSWWYMKPDRPDTRYAFVSDLARTRKPGASFI